MPDTEFARQLRALRIQAGNPTHRHIAVLAGVSHPTVGEALQAKRVPSWAAAGKIVTALGGDPGSFLESWQAAQQGRTLPALEQAAYEVREMTGEIRAVYERLGAICETLDALREQGGAERP